MKNTFRNLYSFWFYAALAISMICMSCASTKPQLTKISATNLPITQAITPDQEIDAYIAPYKKHIDQDMDQILSYSDQDMDKFQGKWQTTIGNFLADITLEAAQVQFLKQKGLTVDFCLLNHGGVRAPISKGNLTTRTAYQIMPFENSLMVAELSHDQVVELVRYIIENKKAHPISGIEIALDTAQDDFTSIKINGNPIDPKATYYVATSDFLINGGDNMNFFTKAHSVYDLNYKLRNIIIDYFKTHPNISSSLDNRIK